MAMDGPHALLALQERDTQIDQLRHRRSHVAERARLHAVTAERSAAEAEIGAIEAERDALASRRDELEAETVDIGRRVTALDKQMRSGIVSAPRDLQAMAAQIEALKRRCSNVEDMELEVMETIEPLEERVAALRERLGVLGGEGAQLAQAAEAAEAVLDDEIGRALGARAAAAADVGPELIVTYDRLRGRLGGVAVARLVGTSCGGCHLTLSAGEVESVRRLPGDVVATCEQCGRLLVH